MKKIKIMRKSFVVVYMVILCVFILFLYLMPKQYEQKERSYIQDSEKNLLSALQEDSNDNSKSELDKLVKAFPMELVVVVDGNVFYNTTSLEVIKPISLKSYVNESAALLEKQGEVDSTIGKQVSYWYTLYRMPNEAGVINTYYLSIAIFTFVLFSLLFAFVAYIQFYFYKPMRNLKDSLKKVSDNNFSEVETADDEINKSFKNFSTRVDNFSKNVLRDYTEQEKELINTKRIFEDNLLYSRAMIHDLKTPVHEMLLENEYELSTKESKNNTEILDFNIKQTDTILTKLNGVLSSLNTDVSYYKTEIEMFDIVELVAKQVQKFGVSLRQKKLFIDLTQPESLMISSSRASVELIIHNMLSNAIQYSLEKSDVSITIDKVEESYQIKCTNITQNENVDRLQRKNQFFNSYSESDSNHQYSSGNGLYFIEELVQLLGGEYEMEIEDNVVTIMIQLKGIANEETK